MTSTRCSILVSVTLTLAVGVASAQSSTAIAEGLFRDGKTLLDEKRYSEACPKFEESARLDPSSGVELALGLCYEAIGKTASAWGAYETAVSLARRDGRKDRERAATTKANALEPKLAHATIDIPADIAQLPGLVVKEDNVVMGSAAWKNAPIEPGTHALEVTATNKKPWSTSFTIDPAAPKTITVPPLEDAPQVVGQQGGGNIVIIREQQSTGNPFRTIAIASLSVGLASLVAGSILGGIALGDAGDAHNACPQKTCSNQKAVSENDTAGTLADWSTALFITSGVLIATSVVMFFIHPSSTASRAAFSPIVAPGFLGMRGAF
jgi:hypothetical protein